MDKNYYDILGVSKDADAESIKSAFRNLAKKYHPDVNKEEGAEEKFKEIQEAYAVLSDPDKKAKYDNFGAVDGMPDDFGDPFGGWNPFGFNFNMRQRGDIKERGDDLKINISVPLEELYDGVHKKLKVKKKCTCERCNGSGSATNETETCSRCHGTGHITNTVRTGFGIQQTISDCPDCHGTGKKIKNPCPRCGGTGLTEDMKEIEFDIPAGMPGNAYFTVRGKGNDGPHRGVPGDLLVVVSELPNDKGLKRDDENNLLYNLNTKITDLIYGADVEVPWVHGYKKIHLEPGTQPGKVITRFGEGFPNPNDPSRKANYKITVNCKIPRVNDLHGKDRENFDRIKKEGNF